MHITTWKKQRELEEKSVQGVQGVFPHYKLTFLLSESNAENTPVKLIKWSREKQAVPADSLLLVKKYGNSILTAIGHRIQRPILWAQDNQPLQEPLVCHEADCHR